MKSIINNAFGFLKDSYGKIRVYARPKITTTEPHGGGWFNRELKLLGLFLALISFSNFILSNNTSALFVPTLSASVNQANLQVNGNQVINSTDKTTEIPFSFTVNTNNRTGYTAILSSETENTALTNASSAVGAKIDSISADLSLNNLPNNTWGYKFGGASSYAPIPALSTPAQIMQTTGKTNGNESNQLSIGMKLADNLESGNYTNKLILSFVSNPYTMRAVMTTGKDFNDKMQAFDPQRAGESSNGFRIKHFKRSVAEPVASDNAIGVESADLSDYEIKLWFNLAEETMYYYSPVETTFLNPNSAAMFAWFIKLQDIDLSHFNTSEVENMMQMFVGLYSCTSLDLSKFDTRNVTNMYQMFAQARGVVSLNLANFDTSQVTDMSGMFSAMENLTNLDVRHFNTENVTNMSYMFHYMTKLTTLDLSNFRTGKVTIMEAMFREMPALTTLNIDNFDTRNVDTMREMFLKDASLVNLNLSSFDTRKVTDMGYMFYGMEKINSLDLSSFITSKVTDMFSMFFNTYNLKTLDISNFETGALKDARYIFYTDGAVEDKLEKIYVNNDFDTSSLVESNGMFINRRKLRGGNGSYLADPSTADKTWLRVDRPGVQGYFTRKS